MNPGLLLKNINFYIDSCKKTTTTISQRSFCLSIFTDDSRDSSGILENKPWNFYQWENSLLACDFYEQI